MQEVPFRLLGLCALFSMRLAFPAGCCSPLPIRGVTADRDLSGKVERGRLECSAGRCAADDKKLNALELLILLGALISALDAFNLYRRCSPEHTVSARAGNEYVSNPMTDAERFRHTVPEPSPSNYRPPSHSFRSGA